MLFKNRDSFPLNKNEKTLREILRALLVIIFSIILKGILNDSNRIKQDFILVPLCASACEIFCILYIINAFTTGNLVRRWANDSVFASLFNFIQTKKNTTDEKTIKLTTKAFGVFAIIILIVTILWELNFYFGSKTV